MSRRKRSHDSKVDTGSPRASVQASPSASTAPPKNDQVICWVLVLMTLALYAPACWFQFVNYDDPNFVTSNAHVQGGFTVANLIWAFTNHDAYLWHPLTCLTHMLDFKLYGLKAGGHHATNIIFHAASTGLLFVTLLRMTGARWRSALVAALFAWHPSHVESVAWVAERKDVLSCFFWMLTLWAYVRYVEQPGWRRYGWVLLFFAAGLLSKPMVVTLPCVLLLLDFWPLRRIQCEAGPTGRVGIPWGTAWKLVREKLPLFVMVAVVSYVTVKTIDTTGAMISSTALPLSGRISNSLTGYARYLGDVFWPAKLAVFYPFPRGWPAWQLVGSGLLLLGITGLAVKMMRACGAVATGWFWFVGTLVPTIGLVQNGSQSMADRYTYIPFVGMFVAVVWGVGWCAERWPRLAKGLPLAAVAAVVACLTLTSLQLQHWRNSETLYRQALRVTEDNCVCHYNLADVLVARGEATEAITHYREAIRILPTFVQALNNLANVLFIQGKVDESLAAYSQTLKVNPKYPEGHVGLAAVLDSQGKAEEAIAHYREALRLKPGLAVAHCGLGLALISTGKLEEAATEFREALRIQPEMPDALTGLGTALVNRGNADEAIPYFRAALQRMPNSGEAHSGLGMGYAIQGKLTEAEVELLQAVKFADSPSVRNNLANVLVQLNRPAEAIPHFRAALQGNPNWLPALNSLAWLLSVDANPKIRDGAQALTLAQRLCELTRFENPAYLNTLAAAYAENGRFTEATAVARKALAQATAAGQTDLLGAIGKLLGMYEKGEPYHDPPPAKAP